MKKKYTLLQTVSTYREYLELTNHHIIPLCVVILKEDVDKLPDYFLKFYKRSWMSMGLNADTIYFSINCEALNQVMKKIKINYIIFNNGEVKKIDRFYPIKDSVNSKLIKRKNVLIKKNQMDDRCLLSTNNSLWNENDYFNFLKDSLSDAAIKTYKKMND